MSPPEGAVWCGLRGNQIGVKFRRQHPIGPYIADFCSQECGLVVEIDGSQHSENADALAYDTDRDAFMENLGLTVLRFSAHEVGADMEGVLASIRHAARQSVLASDPAKQWRYAEALRPGDVLFTDVSAEPVRILGITSGICIEEFHDIQVEDPHSYVTGLCAVRSCCGDLSTGQ